MVAVEHEGIGFKMEKLFQHGGQTTFFLAVPGRDLISRRGRRQHAVVLGQKQKQFPIRVGISGTGVFHSHFLIGEGRMGQAHGTAYRVQIEEMQMNILPAASARQRKSSGGFVDDDAIESGV